MATSSIVIAGATYSDVPSVTLKDTSNADVSFILTSDADATASDIRKNKIAYANGQKIVGDYELRLQEKIADSSTSTQVIIADGGTRTYSVNIESQAMTYDMDAGNNVYASFSFIEAVVVGDTYHLHISYYRAGYDLAYVYDSTFTCEENQFPYSVNVSNMSAPTGEEYVTCTIKKSLISSGSVMCELMGEDDLPNGNTITLQIYRESESYDGLSKVTINPYTLGAKTVTPTESTQVVTAEGDDDYYVDITDKVGVGNLTQGIVTFSFTWLKTLVANETYHAVLSFYRYGYNRKYQYDGDITFTGFPFEITTIEVGGFGRTATIRIKDGTAVFPSLTGDDDTETGNTLTLKLYQQGQSYDGLSQVTVNPIPSDYVHVEGTIPITANGTVDVSAYQYANVNVSGGSQTQSKTATPTKSTQTITPDSGYLLSSVVVNPIPSEYIIPNLQTRTGVTPTKSSQTITPSSGYDGLASVQINAIPSNYIDTTDATASASDIRSGKSAYVNGSKVNGSLVVNKVYVGSTDPASSFGNDGDIYIKVV